MLLNKDIFTKFALLGIISEIIYLLLYVVEPLRKIADDKGIVLRNSSLFIIVVSFLLLLSCLYFFAYQQIRKNNTSLQSIIVFSLLFNITLIFIWPISSFDFFSYIYRARIFSHHDANPFLATYNNFSNDAFYYLINNKWSIYTTLYGPIFILFSSFLTFISGNNFALSFFLLKISFIIFNLLNILLIQKTFNNKIATFLYAWNPLIIFEFCVNGHNDVILIFFLLLAFFFILKKQNTIFNYSLSWFFLILSILFKFITIILVPIFFFLIIFNIKGKKNKLLFIFLAILITTLCFVIFYFPFWNGIETLLRIVNHANETTNSVYFYSFFVLLISMILNLFHKNYLTIAPLAGKITFFFSYLYLIAKLLINWNKQKIYAIIKYSLYAIFLFYFTFFTWLMPWYYTLLIVLLIFYYATEKKERHVYYIIFITVVGSLYYLILR